MTAICLGISSLMRTAEKASLLSSLPGRLPTPPLGRRPGPPGENRAPHPPLHLRLLGLVRERRLPSRATIPLRPRRHQRDTELSPHNHLLFRPPHPYYGRPRRLVGRHQPPAMGALNFFIKTLNFQSWPVALAQALILGALLIGAAIALALVFSEAAYWFLNQ